MVTFVFNNLRNFMKKRSVTTECNEWTHVGMNIPIKGRYRIEEKDVIEFYDLYENTKKEMSNMGLAFKLGILERPHEVSPVLVDVDIKQEKLDRIYTQKDQIQIVRKFKEAIKKNVEVENNTDLTATILEKPSPRTTNNNVIKDGFHVQFMNIIVDKETHKKIQKDAVELLKNDNCIDHLGDVSKLIDDAVVRNCWFVYGSCKDDDVCGYTVSGEINDEDEFLTTEISKYNSQSLSIQNRKMVLKKKEVENEKKEYSITEKISSEIERKSNEKICGISNNEYQRIKELMFMQNPSRADDEFQWMQNGWCLHNIHKGLLPLWIEWSKQSKKFKEGECEKKWQNFRDDGLSISSLYMWANEDNPTAYKEFRKNDCQNKLIFALSASHYDVADYLYSKYNHLFTCSSIEKREWYYFDKHRWIKIQNGYKLSHAMSTDMASDIHSLCTWYTNKRQDTNLSEKEKDQYDNRIKQCKALIMKLKDNSYKNKVLNECCPRFYNNDFLNLLDSKKYLFGFENGIYDIEQLCFRDGRPDDYISLTSRTKYIESCENQNEELNSFLEKVLPCPDIKRYVLKLLASCFEGSTRDQKFHIWTGCGANGKSTLIDLYKKAVGEYQCVLPISLLTKKRSASNAASPEVAASKGKRFATMSEPDKNDRINVGYMKELTGGDMIYCRGLYSNPIEFIPQFKMILVCNDLPDVPAKDKGTWRRMRVVPFESKFVDDPNPSNPNEFKKDPSILDKLDSWIEPFLNILIESLKDYKKNGLKEPELVLKHTNIFKKRSDTMAQYFEDCIEYTENTNDVINIRRFYDHFKAWFRETNSGQAIPSLKEFKENVDDSDLFVKNSKNMYQGIRFVPSDPELSEFI